MGKKLPPNQLALYKRIDEILWEDWHPIGVNEFPETKDEYHNYLPKVFQLVLEDADNYKIANFLDYFVTDSMGLESNKKTCQTCC